MYTIDLPNHLDKAEKYRFREEHKTQHSFIKFSIIEITRFYSGTGRDTKETFKLRRARQYLDTRDPVAGWSIVSSL